MWSRILVSRNDCPAIGDPAVDRHLFQPELEGAFAHHHVEELRDVGPQHERGHPGTADALRVHHPVCARPAQLLPAVLAPSAGHDEQVGS